MLKTWPKQLAAINTKADHTLYCGSRRAGKTTAQLLCFRKMVSEYWPYPIKGMIIDIESDPLRDLKEKSKDLYGGLGDGAVYKALNHGEWRWPNGSELLFRPIRTEEDVDKVLGHTKQFMGFNELSKHKTPVVFNRAIATLDCPNPAVHCKSFATTNPYGPGRAWMKKLFIDAAPYGEIQNVPVELFEGRKVTSSYISIFGSFTENPYVSDQNLATLFKICRDDPELYKAWIEGSWDATVGSAFPNWDSDIHVLDFLKQIPKHWRIDRTMDYGHGHPCAVLWWALVEDESSVCGRTLPVGSLIMINEWYIHNPEKPSKGMYQSSADLARGILEREDAMRHEGVIHKDAEVWGAAADDQIFSNNPETETTATIHERYDVFWERADKTKGARAIGKTMLRDRLGNAVRAFGNKDKELEPGIYFSHTCPHTIEQIPRLENHTVKLDDIADNQLDHIYDAIRYRLYQKTNVGDSPRARLFY